MPASDVITVCGLRERQLCLGGEPRTECIELSASQRVDEISRENDTLTLAPGEALLDQMISAILAPA